METNAHVQEAFLHLPLTDKQQVRIRIFTTENLKKCSECNANDLLQSPLMSLLQYSVVVGVRLG